VEPKAAGLPAPPPPAPIARQPVELAAAPPPPPAPPPVARQPVEAPIASPPAAAAELTQKARSAPLAQPAQRIERLSLGEVALVTSGRPQWRPLVVGRTAQATTVRFVPLRAAQAGPVKIRLLNAARYQGLAARTRRLLAERGWRQLAIGNARRVRQTSIILYPANRRALARRLGAQFGIAIAKRASGTELVVLLGRDSARRNAARGG
ncbi:MAG TPA: LytR C-terminal domain-containing protein, partial [Sphingomicrobium sp.]|nr:LytR C-terminal domain-containing protein [Sphingomicrobium sp.]